MKIWLGDNIPQHTQAFVILILLTSAILIPTSAQSTLVHATGKMRNFQVIGGIVKVLSVPVAFFLLQYGYEPEWALILVLLFDLIGLIVGMFILRTLMPFKIWEYTKKVFFPIIPVTAFALLSSWQTHHFIGNEMMRFIMVVLVSTLVISLMVYLVGMTKDEKALALQLVKGKISRKRNN